MKKKCNAKGFSLMELVIVVTIILIVVGIGLWSMQNRASHFRLARSTRDLLGLMKLAQASAIRANLDYQFRPLTRNSYDFQKFNGALPGFDVVPASDGKLAITPFTMDTGISFTPQPNAIQFRSQGTLGNSGTLRIWDGKEIFTIQWNIGGSLRIQ